jgi:biopolymer transport protein ExbB
MKKILALTLCTLTLFAEPDLVPTKNVELSDPQTMFQESVVIPSQELTAAAPSIVEELEMDPEEDLAAIQKEELEVAVAVKPEGIIIDLGQVFAGSPTIYALLATLSVSSLAIWGYLLMKLRTPELVPVEICSEVRKQLLNKNYDEALTLCEQHSSILFQMVSTGLQARGQTPLQRQELMKAEGIRASNTLWQKIGLLNDIAVVAPMVGLLGTVLGMFYAFYDLNRSMESISALFDGLGISVGTTVGGLIVAILAMMFHAITKYRLMRQLNRVESEAYALSTLIDQGSV